ncbi:MAG: hypothetical protein A4E53_01381 [Pelotomaculum sp. PtaB.Bin104]|nr:MAG: hypothetical protein A4E53_01381 [Pelotomaculum sp. PtaB.Bin104]
MLEKQGKARSDYKGKRFIDERGKRSSSVG